MSTICAISDLHGHTGFDLPPCDILLIAGDICPDRVGPFWTRHEPDLCITWMNDVLYPWLNPFVYDKRIKHVAMTWGNHDWTDKLPIKGRHEMPPNFHLLIDELIELEGLKIWGTPWSNEFCGWAWMKEPVALAKHYQEIPQGVDIIMSHQPPRGYGDRLPDGERCGSVELLKRSMTIIPSVIVCGHIHGGRGVYNHQDTTIYNVSVVNEQYKRVHDPVVFVVIPRTKSDEHVAD